MSLSTPTKLTKLRSLLAKKPQQEVLRLHLHQKHDNLLKEAVLVTIFRKWSVLPPYALTEIGVTTYERQQVNGGLPCPPGPHAEDLLQKVWSMHYRIRENSHLSTSKEDPTEADQPPFHFGYSVYVTLEDAMDLLQQIWHQPIDPMKLEKGNRPVICLSFGNNEALNKTRHVDFDFSPTEIGTTVAMLDAQNIAVQAKITSSGDASIGYLLKIFQIRPYHEHNAGNAAMYVTALAFLSVLRKELYGSEANPKAIPGQRGISSTKTASKVMQWLMDHPTPVPPFGVTTYCSRCSSFVHTADECPNTDFVCSKCLASKTKFRQESAVTHMEGLCIYR